MQGRRGGRGLLADRFADLALDATGADCVAVFLIDGRDRGLFCHTVRWADGDGSPRHAHVPSFDGDDPAIVSLATLREATATLEGDGILPVEWMRALGIKAAVAAPLATAESWLGVLVAGWRDHAPFSASAVAQTATAGSALALALETAVIDQVELALGAERERIAEGLVESASRVLAAINLRTGLLRLVVEDDVAEDVRVVESLARRGLTSLSRGRVSMAALRTEPTDLVAEVRRMARTYEEQHPARVFVDLDGAESLPDDVQSALVRVAQEGLANVERHAEAQLVVVSLQVSASEAILRIRDDGLGPHRVEAGTVGVGLTLARESLEPLGGSIELRDADPGAELLARVPIRVAQPAPVQ